MHGWPMDSLFALLPSQGPWESKLRGNDPTKLQRMITVKNRPALQNVCFNADAFLGRKVLSENTQNFNSGGQELLFLNIEPGGCDTLNINLNYLVDLPDKNAV
jgi:hypothetical protein